jgi:hypothetical protein
MPVVEGKADFPVARSDFWVLTHVGHKDRAKGSLSGRFKSILIRAASSSARGATRACAPMRRRAAAVSSASTASPTSTRCILASTMKRYSSARSMCSRWTATIIWMRFRASAPYRTDLGDERRPSNAVQKFAQQCIQIVGFRLEVAWQTLQ